MLSGTIHKDNASTLPIGLIGTSDLKGITLPATLIKQSEEWLDLAREKSLNKLFKFTLDRIN